MYCQKCRVPLRLDSSLENLNPAAYDLLVGSYCPRPFSMEDSRLSLPLTEKPGTHMVLTCEISLLVAADCSQYGIVADGAASREAAEGTLR